MGWKRGLLGAAALWVLAAAGVARAQTTEPPEPLDQPPPPLSQDAAFTTAPKGVVEAALAAEVATLDTESLRAAPPVGLGDLVDGLPGVRSSRFAPGADRPVMRGLAGPRVTVLSDGLATIDVSALAPDHQVRADPGQAARVEIRRGPTALADGGSAIGGVVDVIDARVPDTPARGGFEGEAAAQGSTVDDGWALAGAAKAGQGPLVFTAGGERRRSGDYQIPGPAISEALAQRLGVPRAGPDEVRDSFADYSRYGAGAAVVLGVGYAGAALERTESDYGVIAVPDGRIKLTQTRGDLKGELDYDLGPFDKVQGAATYAAYQHAEFAGAVAGTSFHTRGFEGRLDLEQRRRGDLTGSVGFKALDVSLEAGGAEPLIAHSRTTGASAYAVERLDRGGYGFEGGLRVDLSRIDGVPADRRFAEVSASGGVYVRPAAGVTLGLSLAHDARAPDAAELFSRGPHLALARVEIGDPDLKPEIANSVEGSLGYARGRFDGSLRLYYARYDGFIEPLATGGTDPASGLPVFRYVQTDADFRGFEAQGQVKLWSRGRQAVTLQALADAVRADSDLGAPALIPPWSATARLAYADARWEGRLSVVHAGPQDRVPAFDLPTRAYTLVDLYGSYRPTARRNLLLFAGLSNLTNAEAREATSPTRDLAPLPGRGFRTGLSYRF